MGIFLSNSLPGKFFKKIKLQFVLFPLIPFLTFSLNKHICAGAVGLADSVFWFIIYLFLTPVGYNLTLVSLSCIQAFMLKRDKNMHENGHDHFEGYLCPFQLDVRMHSLNAILLIMPYPVKVKFQPLFKVNLSLGFVINSYFFL